MAFFTILLGLFVQALQTSSKTSAQALQTSTKQNKRSRAYHAKFKTLANTVWKLCQFWKSSRSADAADVKIQKKPRGDLLKIQHFCNFSLVSLSVYPRSRRGAGRIRQGEGRRSLPPKTALERSDLTEKFQFQKSHTEAETKKTPDQIPVPSKKESFYIYVRSIYVQPTARFLSFAKLPPSLQNQPQPFYYSKLLGFVKPAPTVISTSVCIDV